MDGDMQIIWAEDNDPEGNVQHLLQNGVTKDEAEEVLRNPDNPTDGSRSSDFLITFGWTSTGKHIAVVWEHIMDDPLTKNPITAYETEPRWS